MRDSVRVYIYPEQEVLKVLLPNNKSGTKRKKVNMSVQLAMFILVADTRKKSHARTEIPLLVKDIQAIESRALNDNRHCSDKTGI